MKTNQSIVAGLIAISGLYQGLLAQTTAQANPPPKEDETIVLSPFEVSAERDTGYQATETLAGTRIRTDLRDVGSAIQVVTKEFMQDIGATDNSNLLQYTTNAEVSGTEGTYAGLGNGQTLSDSTPISSNQRIRGLLAADNTRDYFLSDIPWDSYNTDRIDIQRGPNSILFGLGSPGGIINASTQNAEFRNTGQLQLRVGSYGSLRASLDANQVLIKDTLAIRVDGLVNDQKYEEEPAFRKDKRIYGTVRFDPHIFGEDFTTSIKVKAEQGKITANMPRVTPPYDSITPWFQSTDSGGAGQYTVSNLYALGANAAQTNPWLSSISGQQTPTYFINGSTGQVYSINAGYINNGFLSNTGAYAGAGTNAPGQKYSEIVYGMLGYKDYAFNAKLPYYTFAQYKNKSLMDPTVFDFYHHLIDGDNKGEWSNWSAYNISLDQTGWKDRVGIELAYDYQKYKTGSWSLLGSSPALNIDVTQVMQDGTTNPNYGRAFVSSTSGGTGTETDTERKSLRASLFAEFRTADVTSNGFLIKLFGHQRFNFLASKETYDTVTDNWNEYANDNAWDAFTTHTSGLTNAFSYRSPVSLIYLSDPLQKNTTASGANISSVNANIALNSGPVYLFNSQWNSTASPTAPYSIPASNAYLNTVFTPASVTTQASNLSNYVGWNNSMELNTLSFNDGAPLYTSMSKVERVVKSEAGTWQGFFWNDAIVPTLGWRFDEVQTRSISPAGDSNNKGYFKYAPDAYVLPDFGPSGTYKGHSVSGGIVAHLNQLIPTRWDKLPFNLSLTYNNSENFQAQAARVDLYRNPIANPSGKSKDYGVLISTKDNRFSLRVTKYTTSVSNATVSTDSGFIGTINQGLKFRNVFLYQLTGYTWDTRRNYGDPGPGYNNRAYWTQAYIDANGRPVQTVNYALSSQYGTSVPATSVGLETPAQAAAHRDASINAWNQIQAWLDAKGFFKAWGFNPTTLSALTDRSTYEAELNPATNLPTNSKYMPDTSTLANYTPIVPSGYSITGDSQSSGYEFELTANVTKNWRIAFNASQTKAINTNIGGAALDDFVAYMDQQIAGVAGDMRQFNGDYVANNEVRHNWITWRSGYTLLKLQEHTDASELRKWRYNFVTNYTFDRGAIKGVGLGGAYRWQDKVVIGYPVHTDTNGFAAYDLTKPYYGPAEDGLDLWVSYEHKLTKKIDWKIQLNVSNAFQNEGLIPINVEPDGKTWAGVRMRPVQEWFVTNTFTF